jgi:SAM-dependent methyltransferase
MYKNTCRVCENSQLHKVLDLGNSPLANNLLSSSDEKCEMYPLELMYCDKCHNSQLSYVVPAKEMFDHYLYVSSTSKSFREHFERASEQYIKEFNLSSNSLVIDIGSNDGIALKPFKNKGIKVVGVEPAKNIAKIANENGITTINGYFSKEVEKQINDVYGNADLITASNIYAHVNDLTDFTHSVFKLLKKDGCFIVEVQYLLDTIKDLTFDNIYHEHVNYWCVTSINNYFNKLGYSVIKVEHINTHGGSIRVYVKNKGSQIDVSVSDFLEKEIKFGLTNIELYDIFANKVKQTKITFNNNIKKIKERNESIVGYGSPAKATTTLNYFEVSNKDIDFIIEDNKLKHNKFLPGITIPIKSKDELKNNIPNNIIIMAWNFADEIVANNQELVKQGVTFLNIKKLQLKEIE